MTHKKKDCLERPRKVGAKFSGTEIAPDEHLQPQIALDFDGKRDRWNGYDPNEYSAIVEEFQKVEEAKRHLKADKLREGREIGELPDNMVMDDDVPEEDEDKYVDDVDMPGTKVDSKQRITVRKLRIREDTAKYLRNLDPNSAYYDPKTRSMRDNPYNTTGRANEEADFAGDNFVRFTGDTTKHAHLQLFAWEAQSRGLDVHLLAEPTKLEVLQKQFETKKEEFKGSLTKSIIDKYGGEQHLDAPPKSLLLAQTEDYTEYSRQGKILKGNEKPVIRSKYEEDVYPNNHTSIFGSFWRAGQWGYKCCHSLIKNSYCTGASGRTANDSMAPEESLQIKEEQEEERRRREAKVAENPQPPPKVRDDGAPKSLVQLHRENMAAAAEKEREEEEKRLQKAAEEQREKEIKEMERKKLKNLKRKERERINRGKKGKDESSSSSGSSSDDGSRKSSSSSSSSDSSSSSSSDSESEDEQTKKKKELEKALVEEERRQKEADDMMDDRKRKYHSMYDSKSLTEAEMEAYYMKRQREEDPMAQFVSKKKK